MARRVSIAPLAVHSRRMLQHVDGEAVALPFLIHVIAGSQTKDGRTVVRSLRRVASRDGPWDYLAKGCKMRWRVAGRNHHDLLE